MSGSIIGAVIEKDSLRGIEGAVVTLRKPGAGDKDLRGDQQEFGSGDHAAQVTDSHGTFQFGAIEAGRWTVRCDAPARERLETDVLIAENASAAVEFQVPGVTFAAGPSAGPGATTEKGSVTGVVVDAVGGHRVADAAISVVKGPGDAPDIAPMTDESGVFSFDHLTPGKWTFQVVTPAGAKGRVQTNVRSGAVTTVTISVKR